MHRVILGLGPDDPRVTDHVNRNTLDNRRRNLRITTSQNNAKNRGASRGWATHGVRSPHRGVMWDKATGLWRATVRMDGRKYELGHFVDPDEAGVIAACWRAEHMRFSSEWDAAHCEAAA
jgi:hypothetical protein